MKHPDILIIGTGRSGTTAVARVLHEYFGVCFGHDETMLTDFRGETVYEDKGLKKMLRRVVNGEVGIDAWLRKFDATHKRCKAKWTGAKMLDFAVLTLEQFEAIQPRWIVWAYRPRESCIESWIRYRSDGPQTEKENRAWVTNYVDERMRCLRQLVPQLEASGFVVPRINFYPDEFHHTDRWLVSWLRWNEVCR